MQKRKATKLQIKKEKNFKKKQKVIKQEGYEFIKLSKAKIHKYPDPDKVEINEADFQLILRDYESFMKDKISWSDLLVLMPAWAILLTSNFNGFLVFSGEELKGMYLALMLLATIYILKGKIPFLKRIFDNKDGAIEVINRIKEKSK